MEVVEREHIDMVVISTHGISGWHPLVFGSIAEKVVKLVQCPLLLLRSAKPDASGKIPAGRSSGMVVERAADSCFKALSRTGSQCAETLHSRCAASNST